MSCPAFLFPLLASVFPATTISSLGLPAITILSFWYFSNNHFQCVKLRRRNDQVLEMHLGKHELQEPVHCPTNIFDEDKTITLIRKYSRLNV
jgi:hypothetical protein